MVGGKGQEWSETAYSENGKCIAYYFEHEIRYQCKEIIWTSQITDTLHKLMNELQMLKQNPNCLFVNQNRDQFT